MYFYSYCTYPSEQRKIKRNYFSCSLLWEWLGCECTDICNWNLTIWDTVLYDIMIENEIMKYFNISFFDFALLEGLFQSSFWEIYRGELADLLFISRASLYNNIGQLLTRYRKNNQRWYTEWSGRQGRYTSNLYFSPFNCIAWWYTFEHIIPYLSSRFKLFLKWPIKIAATFLERNSIIHRAEQFLWGSWGRRRDQNT